jgi:GT2 family glycosyltransferase
MAEASVLLPSLRPDAVARVIGEFARTNATADYELVVVSPFAIDADRVVHVNEPERRGVIHAVNQAYAAASAEHVVVWSDDALPEKDCLRHMLDFVKSHDPPFVASFSRRDVNGKHAEQWSVYGKLYAGWLCASRRTIDAVGGLFAPEYKNYWADPDLSLRVWTAGGTVDVCRTAWINVAQIDDTVKAENLRSSFAADTDAFFERWHAKCGDGRRRAWTEINKPIPNSLEGHLRAVLRRVPYLRKKFGKQIIT